MKSIKLLIVALCAASTLSAQDSKELIITSRIQIDSDVESAVREELNADSKALTRKYADAEGVHSVETSVEARCSACGIEDTKDEAISKCACSKPKPKSEDIAENKCACSKPKPKSEDITENKCACSKPKPKSENVEGEKTECSGCQGHLQEESKITKDADGHELCSDCGDQLRSCSSCCKKKCCKKCKKCCKKCCSSSCSSSSCCH